MFWKHRTYLDAAAGVLGNPSSPHAEGRDAREQLEHARTALARELEVQADDIIFTSGGTESNALALLGHVRALRARAGRDTAGRNYMHVLYLPTAHASTVENVKLLADEGIQIEALPIANYRVDTDALKALLRPETVLVTMEAVCGETGVVWNTREVKSSLEKLGTTHPLVHVDASQAPWTEKMTRAHFGADLLTLDGAKVGVRGIGALVVHRTIPMLPLYRGGGQERGLRSGSEAPELALAFTDALERVGQGREAFVAEATLARRAFVESLEKLVPHARITQGTRQAPNVVNISLPGCDTDYLVALLDEAGYAVSTKSACETNSTEGSRAVRLLTGDPERARSTLRVSWGPDIGAGDLRSFVTVLAREASLVDTNSSG